jgi:exodeoxyribonuclease V alpha subunit
MNDEKTPKFKGVVERVTFYSEDTNYGVYKVRPDRKMPAYSARDGLVTVVGTMPELGVGEAIEFRGQWVENPRYGIQMRAEHVRPIQPKTLEGIKRYLASGIVKGIGERRAEYIVDHFGEKTLEILNKSPERLTEVPQIKTSLAEKLAEAWADNAAVRQTMIFLQGYGVTSKMATRIHDTFGNETIKQVKQDPYALADEVHGIGFLRADQIAQSMGLTKDAPQRIRAGLAFTLTKMAQDGHTYSPRTTLIENAEELLELPDYRDRIEEVLDQAAAEHKLAREPLTIKPGEPVVDAIYLPTYQKAESKAAELMRETANMPSIITEDSADIAWDSFLEKLAKRNSVELSEQQQSAVKAALTSKISVLTGGPGTGKTTTLQMVIAALEEGGYTFALASPTGRAAKRLSEATERPASTIHRLFGFRPDEGFMFGDNVLDVHFLIIDEASMIDLKLFHSILEGLLSETHLMLVGDIDQLPSVGAGNVLNDVINSGLAYVTRLTDIFRQREGSHIVINAHRINNGEMPFMDNNSNDFYYFGVEDPTQAAEMLVDVVVNRVPQKFDHNAMNDIQVIAPMYRGTAGIDNLNTQLQHALNPERPKLAEKQIGTRVFRVGDKVMQTRNNYEKEVFNGDIGIVQRIDDDLKLMYVVISGVLIEYDFLEISDQLIHAYCISIHRSQGSEYPVVVIPLLTQHYMMLQRNLIYTAITRAREMVVIVGTKQAVELAVRNNKVSRRFSGLLPRLKYHDP